MGEQKAGVEPYRIDGSPARCGNSFSSIPNVFPTSGIVLGHGKILRETEPFVNKHLRVRPHSVTMPSDDP